LHGWKKFIAPGVLSAALLLGAGVQSASADQFSYLEAGLTQEIYTGPLPASWGPGFSWNAAGNLIARSNNMMYEYNLTADSVYNGTNVHSYTAHAVSGLTSGYGTTNGLDGYVYANSNAGLARVDINTWTATVMPGTVGGFYGVGTLPDGRIVYNNSAGSSSIYVYDPVSGTNTMIHNAGSFVDDLAVANTGEIFLAVLGTSHIQVISDTGAVINDFAIAHPADGIAFGNGAAYGNNTDGTITRYDFAGPGYTGAVTETVIASGSGAYGDLASVGPDGFFYVSQWYRTNWDNGTSTGHASIVRIGPEGTFDPSPGVGPSPVPEPGTLMLLGSGAVGLAFFRRRLGLKAKA